MDVNGNQPVRMVAGQANSLVAEMKNSLGEADLAMFLHALDLGEAAPDSKVLLESNDTDAIPIGLLTSLRRVDWEDPQGGSNLKVGCVRLCWHDVPWGRLLALHHCNLAMGLDVDLQLMNCMNLLIVSKHQTSQACHTAAKNR